MALNESSADATSAVSGACEGPQPARGDVYRKECRSTLAFGAAYVLLAHTGIFAIVFGYDNDLRVLGFPLHYFIAIVAGSVGVLIVSIIWNIHADRLEAALQEENARAELGR